ncbi:MAG: SWIM zinc finger family protein [Fimbriimonadales bacterium]|nr:SWIM zinc finger family protein [Fimbriimonadales bacterium]
MSLDEVRTLCDMGTYRNAEQIAAGDQLLHLARSDTTLYAQVQGSKPYTVRIEFTDGAPKAKCTCPAARFSKFCKHAIAVLIVWAQSPERFVYGQQTQTETPPVSPPRGGKRAAKATVERVDLQTQSIEQTLKLTQELAERGLTGVQPAFLEQLRASAANLQSLKTRRLQQAVERLAQLIEDSRYSPVSEEKYTRALLQLWLTARAVEEHFAERRALPDEQLEEMLGRTWRDKDLQPRENLRLMELAYENIQIPTGFRLDISHLIDLDSGELLREMKIVPLNAPASAQGFKPARPEPFLATRVGVYPGYAPKRVKLYETLPLHTPRAELVQQAVAHAYAEWHSLTAHYLQRIADPFAPRELPCLLRYHHIVAQAGKFWLADAQGALLPLRVDSMPSLLALQREAEEEAMQDVELSGLQGLSVFVAASRSQDIPFEYALMRHRWLALFGYLEGERKVQFRPLSGVHEYGVAPLIFGIQVR